MATTTSIRFGTENYELTGQIKTKEVADALAGEHGVAVPLSIIGGDIILVVGAGFPIVIRQVTQSVDSSPIQEDARETSSDAEGGDSTL